MSLRMRTVVRPSYIILATSTYFHIPIGSTFWIMDDAKFQYRRLVSNAAQKLKAQDKQSLVFVYSLPPDDKDKDGITILSTLLMRGHFSAESNPDGLVEVLKVVHRNDLAKEAEKQIKKWRKSRPATPPDAALSPRAIPPAVDAKMKKQFDELVEQAKNFVDQVRKLGEEMAKKTADHHRKAHQMLVECQESADAIQRSLKNARSAAELSDKALSMKEELTKKLNDAVTKMPASIMKEKVEDFVSERSAHSHPTHLATPTQGRAHGIKMPPLTPTQTLTPVQTDSEPGCCDSNNHHKMPVKVCPVPATRPKRNSISQHTQNKPVPSPRQKRKCSESKIPQYVPPKHRVNEGPNVKQQVNEVASTMQIVNEAPHTSHYMNLQEARSAAMNDSEDCTGSTGDSGYSDIQDLLKVPLEPCYAQLQPVPEKKGTDEGAAAGDAYERMRHKDDY
jgi:hypothetical protein